MNADSTVLADAKSARVAPMLPGKAIGPGATAAVNRQFLEAVRRRFRKRSPWRDLPERVSNRNNVFEPFRRRAASGDFERAFNARWQIQAQRFGCLSGRNAGPHPSFICTGGPAIAAVEVRLANESGARRRSQDPCVQFLTRDAPRADELVGAPGTAMPNRPSHRVGDRNQDLEDLAITWTTQPRSEAGGVSFIRAGTGPGLYLVHGVGLRAEAWMAQVSKLSATRHCRAFDLPGHGASRALPHPATLAQYTDRIAAAIDAPGVVAGHSMGAMIALDLAVRHPHLVKGVAALNAIYCRSPEAVEAVRRRAADLSAMERADPEATLTRWFADQDTAERRACRAWLAEVPAGHYKTAYEVFASEDGPADADLARLNRPALFMTGGDEPNSTPAMSEAMARIAPNGRAVIVEGAAHMMPMTHAAEVNVELAALVLEASR